MIRTTATLRTLWLGLGSALAFAACQPAPKPAEAPTAPAAAIDPLAVKPEEMTALDRYIAKPDPVYKWEPVSTIAGQGYTAHVLKLTSQTWRTAEEVDRPVWEHWLTVVVPDEVTSDKALLYIWQGDNTDPAPTAVSDRAARIAVASKSVVAEVGMVPNQPLYFKDSPEVARYEDDLIAYTRVKHFSTKDDEWLVRLAMVKSGIRAMDAIQEFMKTPEGGARDVKQFVVAGGSKRGWTTWLIGATDTRVIGIMPLVIDALNSEAITKHHFEVLGFFAPSLEDYVKHGLFPHKIGTPEYQAVLQIEDAYNYRNRARLTIPKMVINASGDQFFLPDNSQFWYGDMPEEKRLRYVPNAAHNLAGTDAVDTQLAFYESVIRGGKRPVYSWTKAADGTLTVTSKEEPTAVTLWQATNPKARDFRVEAIGNAYTSSALSKSADGTWVGKVEKPAKGFSAFFVELTFDGASRGLSAPLKFTTEVSITPDILPYKWEDAAAKYASTKK